MKELLLQTTQELLVFVKDTASFIAGQIPEYVLEILKTHIIFYGIDSIYALIIVIILTTILIFQIKYTIKWIKYCIKKDKKEANEYKGYDHGWLAAGVLTSIVSIGIMCGIFFVCIGNQVNNIKYNTKQIIKIKESPRVYILEYLRGEIKKGDKK